MKRLAICLCCVFLLSLVVLPGSVLASGQQTRQTVEDHNKWFMGVLQKEVPDYFNLLTDPNRIAEVQAYIQRVYDWIGDKPHKEAVKLMEIAQKGEDPYQVAALIKRFESEKKGRNSQVQNIQKPQPLAQTGKFFALDSEIRRNWADAKKWCERQGGRLPRINNSNSITGDIPSGTPIDGFGSVGAPWPSGLPGGGYWTGTESAGEPGFSWFVFDNSGGKVDGFSLRQRNDGRVACVP